MQERDAVTGLASIDGACPNQAYHHLSLDYCVARHEDDKATHGRGLLFQRTRETMRAGWAGKESLAGSEHVQFQRRCQTMVGNSWE